MLIFSIITACQPIDKQQVFFSSLFSTNENSNYIVIIFRVLLSIVGIISIIFFIYNCVNNGKRSIQDLMSWTAMISLNKGTPESPVKNSAPSEWKIKDNNLNLPGNIYFKK
ncbi:hypothetical protein [Mycoplasmoides pirum]|uniref:hypothetical protein n=1 Tax=Mycoplasmoides pirum TaxID=2122 RepID=UPI00192E44D1|nr:hypothetical protein [Mycoplasmoides pirum]